MPIQFSPTIDAEVQSAHLSVIDLIQIEFGNGLERRWSTTFVPASLAPNLSGNYEPRLLSIGNRRWSIGADDDSVTLVIGNADDVIRDFVRSYGIDVFDGARVHHHRLFPSIQEVYEDYWVGKGAGLTFEEHTAVWDVRFGLGALRQRALRRFQRNCPHVFAGGPDSDCPYNPELGFGTPQPRIFGIATAGTTTNRLVNSAHNAFAQVYGGMLVYNRNRNCVSRVLNVVSVNELELSNPVAGAGTGDIPGWSTGDSYSVGPVYTSCAKTSVACDARGMYGPNDRNIEGLMDARKYFGGSNDASNVTFRGRDTSGDRNRFVRRTLGNDSFDGAAIPVIFGRIRLYGQESIAHANAGEFQHGMFVLSEGQIVDIQNPIVNDLVPDNVGNINEIQHRNNFDRRDAAIAHSDPLTKYGTWQPSGIDDRRVLAVSTDQARNVARHVRELIGRRASVASRVRYHILDEYHYRSPVNGGDTISNPYLFSDTVGGGLSLHGLAGIRVRIETGEDDDSVLRGDFTVVGLITPLLVGMPNNSEDREAYNLPKGIAGIVPHRYTAYPNPIQVAYAFLTNRRWGAGLSDVSVHSDSFLQESDYCEEKITAGVSASPILIGVVDIVPDWKKSELTPNDQQFFTNSIYTTNANSDFHPESYVRTFVGKEIVFNDIHAGGIARAHIQEAVYFVHPIDLKTYNSENDPTQDADESSSGGTPPPQRFRGGYLFTLDINAPDPGTQFRILKNFETKRYKANGALTGHITAVEMFQSILDNCHAIFRLNKARVEVIIKKALTSAEIDDIIENHLFTDRGTQRNIIHLNDISTLKVWRTNVEDVVNEYSVEFLDNSREYHTSRIVVYDDDAQTRAADKLDEIGDRRKTTEDLQLLLTSSLDQAARILALRARESIIQNLFCSFSTSLKNGMKVQVGDIIALDSNKIVGLFNTQLLADNVSFGDSFLFRILEKSESDAYVIDLMCQLHVNAIYTDVVRDFGDVFGVFRTAVPKVGIARNVTPHAPVEDTFVDPYGVRKSQIRVKVTYPTEV